MLNVLGILNEFSNTSQKLAIIFMPFYYLIKNFITNQNLSHHKSTIYYDSRVLTARLKDLYFKQIYCFDLFLYSLYYITFDFI